MKTKIVDLSFMKLKRIFKYLLLVIIPVAVIYFAFTVMAGNLSPGAPPASSMKSLDEVYSVLIGTFDSSSVTGDSNGNILELLKCITNKINGSSCN